MRLAVAPEAPAVGLFWVLNNTLWKRKKRREKKEGNGKRKKGEKEKGKKEEKGTIGILGNKSSAPSL